MQQPIFIRKLHSLRIEDVFTLWLIYVGQFAFVFNCLLLCGCVHVEALPQLKSSREFVGLLVG